MKYSETPGTEKQNLKIFGAKLFASSFVLCPSARAGRNFKVGGPLTSRMTDVQDNREKAQNLTRVFTHVKRTPSRSLLLSVRVERDTK